MNFFEKYRAFFWVEGIALIFLGLVAIALPQITTLAIELFLGWLFLVGGIVQTARTFLSKDIPSFWPSLVSSVFSIVIGVLLLVFPISGILTLTILLTVFFLVEGVSKIVIAFQHREVSRWGWLAVSGVISLILASIIWSGWPGTATWVIGLMVGINMVFLGITLISLTGKSTA